MPCSRPPELDERQLADSLEGLADSVVVAHLAQCPYCHARAQQVARFQRHLTARLFRANCPGSETLGEYQLGLLTPDRSAAVEQHLSDCPLCTRELTELKTYLNQLQPDLEFSPLEKIKVLIAQLINESGGLQADRWSPQPAVSGLRGRGGGPALYRVNDVQIAVEVLDDILQPDRRTLLGLVFGVNPSDFSAQLWQAEQLVTTTTVDAGGNFAISGLVRGQYELILKDPAAEIHIQSLEV